MKPARSSLPLVLVPELFRQTGGVQRYSIRFIEALDRIYGSKVPVISMNDRDSDFPSEFMENRRVRGCGNGGTMRRKFSLIAETILARPQSIFSTHPGPAPWLAVLKRLTGIPFLCVAHGIDVWSLGSLQSKAISKASLILPVSHFTKEKLAGQLPNREVPFSILSNMVEGGRFFPDTPTTDWRKRLEIPTGSKVLLSICRISATEKGKGYDLILESLPTLIEKHPSLVWVLGGKGDDLPRLEEKAKDLGVAEHCRFPGFIPDEELPDLYRSSDLFVLPSRKEGFGIVFLEAVASGLPVIAGNRDGSVDALAGGTLGRLIDPESADELIAAIESALREKDHDPTALHHSCIRHFGRDAFENRLRNILSKHPRLAGSVSRPPSVTT